ncbi:MAG TPA: helix-hairpin-helix domain-containing protein, partial [Candidatus Deferrimicrobium sp.]|nr:helix-hairpin-helix domain-containing protein [Candidatus Deferrimicrobium sp.]
EGYDISTFQGRETVGSMVVFEEGRPRTGEYRRFKIRTVQGPNDFASHQEVLDELGLHDLPLAGLAKEREELFRPAIAAPVVLPSTSSALYLVQRLRDEAHRFAITYHRDLRSKRQTRSAFDDLPGVGPKRRRALLRVFGSAKRVREAPVEQIAAVPGIGAALAARIKSTLEA